MSTDELQELREQKNILEKKLAALTIQLEQKNRELEIEAALEKVRIRTSAMQSSSELAETSAILFQELNHLQIKAIRTAVGIFDDPNDAMELWLTSYSEDRDMVRVLDYVNLHIHPVFENILTARRNQKPYALTILSGEDVKNYYRDISTYLSVPEQKAFNTVEYFYSFFFPEGAINVVSSFPLAESECSIMLRFAFAFGLIYTRFIDLQKAEAAKQKIESNLA